MGIRGLRAHVRHIEGSERSVVHGGNGSLGRGLHASGVRGQPLRTEMAGKGKAGDH